MCALADGALGVRDCRSVQVLVETSGNDAEKESNLLAFVRIVVLVHDDPASSRPAILGAGPSFYQAVTWWRRPRDECGTRTGLLDFAASRRAPDLRFSW